MKKESKKNIALYSLVILYIVLAASGLYGYLGIIIFPILSIPLAAYMLTYKQPVSVHFLYNLVIVIVSYIFTRHLESALIYIIGVCIPAYSVVFLYKKKLPLPNIIMNETVIVSSTLLVYILIMKEMGINFEQQFIVELENTKELFLQILGQSFVLNGITDLNVQSQMNVAVISLMDYMKQIFPAFVVFGAWFLTTIQVLIFNALLRRKDKSYPSAKQLLYFKMSRFILLIFVAAMLMVGMSSSQHSGIAILGINLFVIINMTLSLMGALSLAALMQKTMLNGVIKVICYILIFIMFWAAPTLLILFGGLDTLFNYRKVTIIV